jgi:hypothetical protein
VNAWRKGSLCDSDSSTIHWSTAYWRQRTLPERDPLLDQLETFVDSIVHIGTWTTQSAELRTKLDVLERVVELLRLRTGHVANRISLTSLLAEGISVGVGASGRPTLRVGGGSDALGTSRPIHNGLVQSELQLPLMLFLLTRDCTSSSIGTTISDLVSELQLCLTPADVETTGSGVTRVVTTIRSAARTLRLHGLMLDTDQTAFRSWELSVLGLLVAAFLYDAGHRVLVEDRHLPLIEGGKFGRATHLAEPVREVLRSFADPAQVGRALNRVCGPNRDTFASFDDAVKLVAAFCRPWQAPVTDRSELSGERRRAAKELMKSLSAAVPTEVLARDMYFDLGLKELTARRRKT